MSTLSELIVTTWNTDHRVTTFLVENLSRELLLAPIPGTTRRTIGMVVCHIHNARCSWVRTLGEEHGVVPPEKIDRHNVQRKQLIAALNRSGRAVARLLKLGCERDGQVPPSRSYVWRNLQLDVGHVLAYLIAHQAHHRGQIVLAARQLGHPLAATVTGGLWQWRQRAKEVQAMHPRY